MKNIELELIEEYIINNERRFRVRIKGTNIILNVSAETLEEAAKKALDIINKLGISVNA